MFGNRTIQLAGMLMLGVAAGAAAQTPQVGKPFPDFSEKDAISGETVSLKGFRGRLVLVDFWATW